MKPGCTWLLGAFVGVAWSTLGCEQMRTEAVTVPMTLDHNRMLVDAEIQRLDGSWRPVRLWVDTGNPEFFISEALARDLGLDLSAAGDGAATGALEVAPPAGVRLGGMALDFQGVTSRVLFEPRWLFGTMHNDANLPSTVLQRYHVVFDYPQSGLTIAEPGRLRPQGVRAPASVNPATGIVQLDALIDGEPFSFALDNGASYSFASDELVRRLAEAHPDWPRCTGAVGCANIWGWWPREGAWPVLRVPELDWGGVRLTGVGIAGLPPFFQGGSTVGAWYSQKTAHPVEGFLGPNAFKAFRVEIDYAGGAVYFAPGARVGDEAQGTRPGDEVQGTRPGDEAQGTRPGDAARAGSHDMDLVGLTLRLGADGRYLVIGVAEKNGQPSVAGVEPGDVLLEVGNLIANGATMGAVVDALRGEPGELRRLVLERDGARIVVDARVERLL